MFLGQHFLLHKPTLERIVSAIDPQVGDTIIEIGPGHGELTEKLKNKRSKLKIIGIEKDALLVSEFHKKFADDKDIEIIDGDALEILPQLIKRSTLTASAEGGSAFGGNRYKLIGNIPYYITGHLFRVIGELKNKPVRVVFLIQQEVAQRIIAQPPRMNLLAASIQVWAEPKILFKVSRGHFKPQPQVESAVISLTLREKQLPHDALMRYYRCMRILFKQPRKTILNNLASGMKNQESKGQLIRILHETGVSPRVRPQDLNSEKISQLSRLWTQPFLS